jgi:carbon-monoxide dehydrogenase medium subunit
VAAREFARGPGISIIKPDEILTDVYYPAPRSLSASSYYKLAGRKALEIAMVGVAVWLALEEPPGPVSDVRVSLGAVGPTPILAESVYSILHGKVPTNELLAEAARAAAEDARPIDDHRGSAWYRVKMVELLTYRLLDSVLRRIRDRK